MSNGCDECNDYDDGRICLDCRAMKAQVAHLEKVIEEASDLLEQYAPPAKFRTWEISSRC